MLFSNVCQASNKALAVARPTIRRRSPRSAYGASGLTRDSARQNTRYRRGHALGAAIRAGIAGGGDSQTIRDICASAQTFGHGAQQPLPRPRRARQSAPADTQTRRLGCFGIGHQTFGDDWLAPGTAVSELAISATGTAFGRRYLPTLLLWRPAAPIWQPRIGQHIFSATLANQLRHVAAHHDQP